MFTIESAKLKVGIEAKSAELQSIFHKQFNQEYMWDGNPAYWPKHSPVLFPIVGTLKEDTFYFEDKSYHLPRHGFARDLVFEVKNHTKNSIGFFIKSSAETLLKYPFHFEFYTEYVVQENELITTYTVLNVDNKDMYFSVGAHPAFKLPLTENTSYEDYFIEFNRPEKLLRWPISKQGLIEKNVVLLKENDGPLALSKELFNRDALVFKNLKSDSLTVKSFKTSRGFQIDFPGFPYLGLWAAPGADFLCIEPWCGIADSVETDQQFVNKEGIIKLSPQSSFRRSWKAILF